MAQKINPIALRLNTNLNFDSCWYNNSNYVNLLIRDIKVKNYINLILKKMKFCHARFLIENLHNKHKINVFFCNPIKSRAEMLVSLRVKNYNTNKLFKAASLAKKPGTRNFTQLNYKNPLANTIQETCDLAANSLSCFSEKKDCLQLKKYKVYNYLNLVTSSLPVFSNSLEETSVSLLQKHTCNPVLPAELKHSKNSGFFTEKNTFSPATGKYAYTIEKLNLIYIKYFLIKYISSGAGQTLRFDLPGKKKNFFPTAGNRLFKNQIETVFLPVKGSFLSICKQKNAHLVENLLFLKFPQLYISLNTFKKQNLYTKKNFLLKKSCLSADLPTNKTNKQTIFPETIKDCLQLNKNTCNLALHTRYTRKIVEKFNFNWKKSVSNLAGKNSFFKLNYTYISLLNKTFLKQNISGSKKNNYLKSSWQPSFSYCLARTLKYRSLSLLNTCTSTVTNKLFPAKSLGQNKLQQLLTPRAFTLNNYILLSLINAQYLRKTYTDYCNLSINSIKHTQIFSKKPLISLAKTFPNKILKTGGYKTHIESMIHENFALSVNLQFFKTSNIFQSASFLCNEIVYYLEKKVPFFKLKNIVLKKLTHDCSDLPCLAKLQIKGIRVMCSGVVPGKSKKSQKSKIQSFKYGETSLHVFSCKIDFKSKTALTNFGTLGIKVWICYA